MSLNKSHTADGRGVLIYNGELILLYIPKVNLTVNDPQGIVSKGTKKGCLYLTTHRMIFIGKENGKGLKSLALPFGQLRDVNLEQPLLGANYLKGDVHALSDGGFEGAIQWRLSFPNGGCIEFGRALLKANDMVKGFGSQAPPAYVPVATVTYYAAPSQYYYANGGCYQQFQAPVQAFPDRPPEGSVYMYNAPPPYAGIGGYVTVPPYPVGQPAAQPPQPHPQGQAPPYPNNQAPPYPGGSSAAPPQYAASQQAGPLPEKTPIP